MIYKSNLFFDFRIYLIFRIIFIVLLLKYEYAESSEKIKYQTNDGIWITWCKDTQKELLDAFVFNTIASDVNPLVNTDIIRYIEFGHLSLPYIQNQPLDISFKKKEDHRFILNISYDSSFSLVAIIDKPEKINDIFDRLLMSPPSTALNEIIDQYGSLNDYFNSWFDGTISFFDLRISGFQITPNDLECSIHSAAEDIKKVAMILAASSSDFEASKSGTDVAYWSHNSIPGIIIRSKHKYPVGSENPKIIWSGEFQSENTAYKVLMSFDINDQEKYDIMGELLANPISHRGSLGHPH